MDKDERIAELEGKIKKSEKLASLGTLMAGITHEIQNPLNFVINFSKMSTKLIDDLQDILEDHKDAFGEDQEDVEDIIADLQENLQKIDEHGERAISIVRNILLYSRGRADQYIPTDIPKIVKEYVWLSYHSMRANLKNFNVTINESYPSEPLMADVVTQDICRAVLNIMNNASYAVWKRGNNSGEDYSPTVDVSVESKGDNCVITITDNGIGMNEDVQKNLYEEFYTTKPAGEGTGLGMPLTREIIVDKHKGDISFTSKEGEGTTFVLSFPMKRKLI